jgi:DivIVA domain-containing protein
MASAPSRPDPLSPEAVANATFSTARKGFDPQQVHEFLRRVAGELNRLQEQERILTRELDSTFAAGPPELDEDTVTRLLGEEATRILQTARESGSQIKSRAEESAARLLRDATDEAQRQREEADREAARRRSDAVADAEAELTMAKQQGREMVEEARAYRERVLSELARRRELALQQIEQLVHGRDRLLEAFERARMVAIDVVAEISPLGSPEEYADFEPTGPLPPPAPVADAPTGAAEAADEVAAAAVAEAEVAEAEVADASETAEGDDAADRLEPPTPDATVVPFPTAATGDADDVFARLRADTDATRIDDTAELAEVTVDEDEASEAAEEAAETPFGRRDAALVPLIVASARKLKRVLADEQNEVLDALRRREPVRSLDALVPAPDEQAQRYADAIAPELVLAAEAGAASVEGKVALDLGPTGTIAPVHEALASGLVAPLRDRLERCVEEGDGDNDAVTKRARAVYREWKTQHIDEQLDDVFRIAYGRGACDALEPGTPVSWIVDPDGPACPDAEDNSLAGVVELGQAFPTGHGCAPAHAGCRCLIEPADR